MSENEKRVPKRRFKEFENAEGWEQRKLKDVSIYSNGGSFENDVQEKGRYELITLKSVDMDGNLVHSGRYVDIEVPTLTKGTLVMILSEQSPGLLGMTAQIPVDNTYILNQRVAEIRPDESVESYFLSMAINKNQPYFSRCGAGTKVQNISKSNVENYEFLCPQLQEQQKIGQFFTTINKSIIFHQRKLEKVKTLKKAYLTEMFPAEGEHKPKLRFAEFTGDWEQRKLEELSGLITKGTTPLDKSGVGNINFIKIENIDPISGKIMPISKITTEEHEGYLKRSQLQENDLLFSIAGTLGRVTAVNKEILPANTNQALAIIRLNTGYLDYIMTYLKGKAVSEYIKKNPTVGAQPNLSLEQVSNLIVSLPKIEEQKAIGTFFKNLNNLITLHQRKLEKLQNIKKAYLNEMFI